MLGSSRAHTRPMPAAGVQGPQHSARLPGFPFRLRRWGCVQADLRWCSGFPSRWVPLAHTEAPGDPAHEALLLCRAQQARGQGPARQSAPCSSFPARTPRRRLPTLHGPSLPGPDKRRRPSGGGMAQGHRAQLKGIPVVKAEQLEQQDNVILGYNHEASDKNPGASLVVQRLSLRAPNTGDHVQALAGELHAATKTQRSQIN